MDLSDPLGIQNFVSTISISNASINVLINNAAISADKSNNITIDVLRTTLEVNLIGTIDLTEKLLPFITDNGHIINVSSGAGSLTEFRGSYAPSYQISKTALNMYTRTLADRLKHRNIAVSSVNPGWVRTDMGGPNATRDPAESAEEIFKLATSKVNPGQFWYQGKKIDW